MQEFYVQQDMFVPEKPEPQESAKATHGKERRRVQNLPVEQTFDFSQVDFTQKEIRESLGRAYRVLLSLRQGPQSTEGKGNEQ